MFGEELNFAALHSTLYDSDYENFCLGFTIITTDIDGIKMNIDDT